MRWSRLMTMKRQALRFLLVLWATPAAAFDAKTPATDRDAILVSWDGALREHLRADLAAGKLPNLARLTKGGSLIDIDVTGHFTDTKAGHSELLSGYGPDLTGVRSDGHFAPIPAGLSVFERLRKTFPNLTTIMLTGKDHNLGSRAVLLLPRRHQRVGRRQNASRARSRRTGRPLRARLREERPLLPLHSLC